MSNLNENTPPHIWFRVFDARTLEYICDVKAESDADSLPLHPYDPRIGGHGDVVWQPIETLATVAN